MLIVYNTAALVTGLLLDAALGDPQGWPHIIRLLGRLITVFEKWLYPLPNKRLGGTLLTLFTVVPFVLVPGALLMLLWHLSPWLYLAGESLLIWQLLAAKSLQVESRRVYDALEENDLPSARRAVSMIVGRDTQSLDAGGVIRAAVETVAENTADGVAAPLFYIALGGGVLGCLYKAVNTLDSSVGYRNERYLDFGRFSARLDDVLNYLPSRLCAVVMIAGAGLCGFSARDARRVWRRDRRKHASPNSAQTESVMAGALGLRLAGDAWYFGVKHEKPYIGDDIRPIEPADILRSHKLLHVTVCLLALLALAVRGGFYAIL
ncbi:MAG: adenosylcobinamide-phosphate synthase CbiB [Oscillibacter sp.]|nr:adenosylcobinamide-phosphate synthase CbiB [Oscillibacter sp.]